MPDTYVIHWTMPDRRTGRTLDVQSLVLGDEAACARAFMAGDEFTADRVRRIDCYDAAEGWAKLVPLEDIARTIARLAEIEQAEGGDITSEVYDFVHDWAGAAYARGLRIRGSAYEAA